MSVSAVHPDYIKTLPKWQITSDCVEGSNQVKIGQVKYLPKPNSEDISKENDQRYADYIKRANFVNFTGHTKDISLGAAFRIDPIVELPSELEYIENNLSGNGITLEQSLKRTIGNQLEFGRMGILTDYTDMKRSINGKAKLVIYNAVSILNWRTMVINGEAKLSLIVLQENHENIDDDGFGSTFDIQYRVLKLIDNVYIQEVYDDNENLIETFEPTKWTGVKFDSIPFQFIGSEENDETIDNIPLYDIAEINVSHYQNSADYEESCFMVGQPTPYASGLNQNWVDEVFKGRLMLGSRAIVPLPEGGTFGLVQANPNQMPLEGMKMKESQMLKIGARIIVDSGGVETAEAARIRMSSQNSGLNTIISNAESGIEQALFWASEFMSETPSESVITLNRQFFETNLTEQQIMSMIALSDINAIDAEDINKNLKRAGWIESDKEVPELKQLSDDVGSGLIE